MDIFEEIENLLKNNNILECISLLRQKTKCYTLIKILCEKIKNNIKEHTKEDIKKYVTFWNDYSIALYYLGDKENAYICYDYIFPLSKSLLLSQDDIDFYTQNMLFSMPTYISYKPTSINTLFNCNINHFNCTNKIKNILKEYYNPLNPSIIKSKDSNKYIMNIRSVNYKFDENFKYITYYLYDNLCNTINYIVYLDENFNILEYKELEYEKMQYSGNFDGWEDIRLFYYNNKIHCSATTLQATENRKQTIILSDISNNLPYHITLNNYGSGKIQKNWTPIVNPKNNKLYFIYSFFPLIVLEYDENIKNVKINQVSKPKQFNKWRGGTPAISLHELGYENLYLCVIHESEFPNYKHKFVILKEKKEKKEKNIIFTIYNESQFFYFIDGIVEFCSGIVLSHDKQNFILTFGKLDREVFITNINKSHILNLIDK
jgi:hypothetical protein